MSVLFHKHFKYSSQLFILYYMYINSTIAGCKHTVCKILTQRGQERNFRVPYFYITPDTELYF